MSLNYWKRKLNCPKTVQGSLYGLVIFVSLTNGTSLLSMELRCGEGGLQGMSTYGVRTSTFVHTNTKIEPTIIVKS